MAIKKAYNINNSIEFKPDGYDLIGQTLIEQREFTADELKWPKISGGKIVVDTAAKQAYEDQRIIDLKPQLISEISQKTNELITNAGFTHNNIQFSTSVNAQMNMGNLVNMDQIGIVSYPYLYSRGDHQGDYSIADQAELHAMASKMSAVVVPLLRAGSALEAQVSAMTTLQELEAFNDNR